MGKKPKRCRSWRYERVEGHEFSQHRPFECRKCWRPCRNLLEENEQVRCGECERALAAHPDLGIRRELLDEDHLSIEILKTLALDGAWIIAETAQTKLEALEHHEHRLEGLDDA